MTPEEKADWWARTLDAIEKRDPRVHLAMLTAMILRHGRLEECPGKAHTHVIERITIEDLMHTVQEYHFSVRVPETGVIEIQALSKGDVDGTPPNIGQSGPAPRRRSG